MNWMRQNVDPITIIGVETQYLVLPTSFKHKKVFELNSYRLNLHRDGLKRKSYKVNTNWVMGGNTASNSNTPSQFHRRTTVIFLGIYKWIWFAHGQWYYIFIRNIVVGFVFLIIKTCIDFNGSLSAIPWTSYATLGILHLTYPRYLTGRGRLYTTDKKSENTQIIEYKLHEGHTSYDRRRFQTHLWTIFKSCM